MSVSREEPESTWTVTSLCDLTADYGTQEQNPQVYPRRVNQGEIKLFLLKWVLCHVLFVTKGYELSLNLEIPPIFSGDYNDVEFNRDLRQELRYSSHDLHKWNKWALGPIWKGKRTWLSRGWGYWKRGRGRGHVFCRSGENSPENRRLVLWPVTWAMYPWVLSWEFPRSSGPLWKWAYILH